MESCTRAQVGSLAQVLEWGCRARYARLVCGLCVAGALGMLFQSDPHDVVALRAYLEVHQLELEKLSTQIRESKRNSRLVSAAGT